MIEKNPSQQVKFTPRQINLKMSFLHERAISRIASLKTINLQ